MGSCLVQHRDATNDNAKHSHLRQHGQNEPGQNCVHPCHSWIRQQRMRIIQRRADLHAERAIHIEGQVADGIEEDKAGAQGRLVHEDAKGQRQQNDHADGLQYRPQIAAGLAAIGRLHLSEHERRDGAQAEKTRRLERLRRCLWQWHRGGRRIGHEAIHASD